MRCSSCGRRKSWWNWKMLLTLQNICGTTSAGKYWKARFCWMISEWKIWHRHNGKISGADSIRHEGARAPTFTNGRARGAPWVKNSKQETDQNVPTIAKALTITTTCAFKAKKIIGAFLQTGTHHSLSNSFRHHWVESARKKRNLHNSALHNGLSNQQQHPRGMLCLILSVLPHQCCRSEVDSRQNYSRVHTSNLTEFVSA